MADQYQLPACTSSDWKGYEQMGYQPTARQQIVIEAIRAALSDGHIYPDDIERHGADRLRFPQAIDPEGYKTAETVAFGMDCYYARGFIRAEKEHLREQKACAQLRPVIGQNFGTLVFSDYKRTTGVTLVAIQAPDAFLLQGRRGARCIQFTASAYMVQCAMDRAAEMHLRKDGFRAFCQQNTSYPAATNDKILTPTAHESLVY